jgi:hypothetical protein
MVDGGVITMARVRGSTTMEMQQRIWLLTIDRRRIEGTLTMHGKVVFRRMTLKKDD